MADAEVKMCEYKWNSIFKKCLGKSSKKYYRSFHLDLLAIFLGLKPSFLFDYAVLNVFTALTLIEVFAESNLLSRRIDVIRVGDDFFFADLKCLIDHLNKSLAGDRFTVIDISGTLQEPRVMPIALKSQFAEILAFLECSYEKEKQSRNPKLLELKIDQSLSLASVYGFLLGYPTIYWCDSSSPSNCLSLVALKRYTVTLKVIPSITNSRTLQDYKRLILGGCEGVESCDHIVFSFTAPVSLQCYFDSKVRCWLNGVCDLSKTLGIAEHLMVDETTVSYTQVTL